GEPRRAERASESPKVAVGECAGAPHGRRLGVFPDTNPPSPIFAGPHPPFFPEEPRGLSGGRTVAETLTTLDSECIDSQAPRRGHDLEACGSDLCSRRRHRRAGAPLP